MRKRRMPVWLMVVLAGLGLILAIPALWVLVSVTARPLYPTAESVPAVSRAAPAPEYAAAVEKARRIVRAGVAGQNLPGLSVAAGVGGEVVWAEGFGFADLKSSVAVTPEHQFRIGTASTALMSAAAGLLLEKGKLSLDDEIQKYVPAFPKKQWPVRLREVMANTAGIHPAGGDGGPLFTKHCERPVEAVPYFAQNALLFRPGTQYGYSDHGWILVSAAVEAAAEQPFLTFLREQVFDRLGMRDTFPESVPLEPGEDFPLINMVRELIYDPEAVRGSAEKGKKPAGDRVTPYFTRFASNPNYGLHVMRPLDYSCYAGARVFVSTPSDLVRFGMAMTGGKLLQPATVELLQTSQRLASGEETGYGLGWYSKTIPLAGKRTRVAGHDGEVMGGMVASLIMVPAYGIAVAVTSNISHADTYSLAVQIAEVLAERPAAAGLGGASLRLSRVPAHP